MRQELATCTRFDLREEGTYGFVDSRTALGVPSFDAAVEALAGVVHVVEPVLVADGVEEAVAHHAFCEVGEGVGAVVVEVAGCC